MYLTGSVTFASIWNTAAGPGAEGDVLGALAYIFIFVFIFLLYGVFRKKHTIIIHYLRFLFILLVLTILATVGIIIFYILEETRADPVILIHDENYTRLEVALLVGLPAASSLQLYSLSCLKSYYELLTENEMRSGRERQENRPANRRTIQQLRQTRTVCNATHGALFLAFNSNCCRRSLVRPHLHLARVDT